MLVPGITADRAVHVPLPALVLVVALVGMAFGPGRAAGDQEAKKELAQEYYQSFKDNPGSIQGLRLIGPEAEQCVKFEPEGLRITLPFGYAGMRPNTGVVTDFSVKGDFEITVSFEILKEPEPADTVQQTRFTLFAPLDKPGRDRATLSRRVTATGGTDYFAWLIMRNETSGKDEPRGNTRSTEAKTGRLRLVRNGAVLSYYASEGHDESFTLLQQFPFGQEDLKDVRLVGSTGGPKASLDVRVTDLRIRAESLPNAPAAALPEPGGKRWLLIALASALAVTLALGAWLYVRQRRRAGKLPVAVLLAVLAGLASSFPGTAAGQEPKPELAQEYYQSLKGSTENRQGFRLIGPDAEHYVKFEPEGLRITLPLGHRGERPSTGFATDIAVRGDFEITLTFEILKEPEPADIGPVGTRLSLGVFQDTPNLNGATISRSRGAKDGKRLFVTWMGRWNSEAGKSEHKGRTFPTEASTGRLRLVRNGADLSYYASEGFDGEFTLLHKYSFGAADLKEVRIAGSTGGPKASLDVRVTDLRVRAESLSNVPSAALPAALPTPGGKRWLLIALALALAITLAVGVWLYVRQSRRAGKVPAPAPARQESAQPPAAPAPAAPTPASFPCPGCGKNLKARVELAGKKVKCPQCGQAVVVPSTDESARAAP